MTRDGAKAENFRGSGGHNLPPLVEIGLTDLPKTVGTHAPYPLPVLPSLITDMCSPQFGKKEINRRPLTLKIGNNYEMIFVKTCGE